jgi:hypothetical protein
MSTTTNVSIYADASEQSNLRNDLAAVEKVMAIVKTWEPWLLTDVECATCIKCLSTIAHAYSTVRYYPNPEA